MKHAGLTFTWPSGAGNQQLDNIVASGQTLAVDGTSGSTLGFLVTARRLPAGRSGFGAAGGPGLYDTSRSFRPGRAPPSS